MLVKLKSVVYSSVYHIIFISFIFGLSRFLLLSFELSFAFQIEFIILFSSMSGCFIWKVLKIIQVFMLLEIEVIILCSSPASPSELLDL